MSTATNKGSQNVFFAYRDPLTSVEFDSREKGMFPLGIYSGGMLTRVSDVSVLVAPMVCEISDGTYQVRMASASAYTLTVSSGAPFVVLRWTYNTVNAWYVDILAVAAAGIQDNDLVVGKCVYAGSVLESIDYTQRMVPVPGPGYLEVVPTVPASMAVHVKGGWVTVTTDRKRVQDGDTALISAPSSYPRIDLIGLDANGSVQVITGAENASPQPPDPGDYIILAEIWLMPSTTTITKKLIVDVRPFINLGGGGGGSASADTQRYDVPASGGQSGFTIPFMYTPGRNQIMVFRSGVIQKIGDDFAETSSTSITFVDPCESGEPISVIKVVASIAGDVALHEKYVATPAQTVFTLLTPYAPDSDSLLVYRNGKLLTVTDDYAETDSVTVTINVAAEEDDVFLFKVIGSTTGIDPKAIKGILDKFLMETDEATPDTLIRIHSGCVAGDDGGAVLMEPGTDIVINSASSGVNGRDTGSLTASTWYALYIIMKADLTIAGLMSTNFVSPTMPSGYIYKRRVGAVYVKSDSKFWRFYQENNHVSVVDKRKQVAATTSMINRTWYEVDLTAFLPSTFLAVDLQGAVEGDGCALRIHTNDTDVIDAAGPGPAFSDYIGTQVAYAEVTGGTVCVDSGAIPRFRLPTRSVFWYRNGTTFTSAQLAVCGYFDKL